MVGYSIGEYNIAGCQLHQVFQVDAPLRLLFFAPHRQHEGQVRVPSAVRLYLLCADQIALLSVLLDGEIQYFVAEGHRVRELSNLLPNDKH